MRKIATVLVLAVLAVSMVAAQASVKKILKDKDIDAFIANFKALEADLDALENKYDYIFAEMENVGEEDDLGATFIALRSLEMPKEIQDVFKKHGLGANGFEKMIVITAAFQSLEMDAQLALFREQYKDNPEMLPYLEQAEAQNESLRKALHKDDMKVVQNRIEDLRALLAE